MLWLLILLLLPRTLAQKQLKWAPGKLHTSYYYWPDYLAQERILLLTEEIVKGFMLTVNNIDAYAIRVTSADVELKMVMSSYIQQGYHNSFDYEIGYMASCVKDLFRHMLLIYKANCNPTQYANRTINSVLFLDLLHKVQGDYREILMYRDMYVKAAVDEAKRQKKERQILRFKEKKKKTHEILNNAHDRYGLSREAEPPPEKMRPSRRPWYVKYTRTLKPWQRLPEDSKEWEKHLQDKRKTLRSERSQKNQDEEKYKAVLRKNFNKAREAEPHDTGFW